MDNCRLGLLSGMRKDNPLEWCMVITIILAIIIVGMLEFYALSKGINGTQLSISMTVIGGMIGVLGTTLANKYKCRVEKARYRAEAEWRK